MLDLISLTRMMNLYYHHLHNIAKGVSFEGDHEIMNEFYTQIEGSYDLLIERYIGLGGEMNTEKLLSILKDANDVMNQIPVSDEMEIQFRYAVSLEESFRSELQAEASTASLGTENLLAQLADESEQRSYKLKQRLK